MRVGRRGTSPTGYLIWVDPITTQKILTWGAASALPSRICLTPWQDSGLTQVSRSLTLQVTGAIPGVQAVGLLGEG